MKCMYKTFALWLALALTPAMAQQDAAEADTPEFYQVEILVFRHMDQSRTTQEIPRLPEAELTLMLEQDLARLGTEPMAPADPATPAPGAASLPEGPDWFPINNEHLLLTDTAKRLERLEAYQVITYSGWGQEAPDVTVAEAIDLETLGIDPGLLAGSVELHQRRYLHLAVDVTLAEDGGRSGGLLSSRPAAPAIKDSRRIRLEQLQYFDQPAFGIVAVVSRIEAHRDELAAGGTARTTP